MRSDEDDDGPVVPRPDGEEAVVTVEVPAANVLQPLAGEAIARRLAALVLKLTDDTKSGSPPAATQGPNSGGQRRQSA